MNPSLQTYEQQSANLTLDHKTSFRLKLAELDAKLKAYDPNMGMLIMDLHKQLQSLPELSYILTHEEIGSIVEGLKRTMKIEITASTSSSKKASIAKDLSEVSLDDF